MSDDNKKNKEVIKTTYKDKDNKYEIEVNVGEKKEFTPKDKKDGPKITVEGKGKTFFKNKFTVNDEEKSTLTGGALITIITPIVLVVLFGVYFFFFRKKKNKHEEEVL